MDGTEAADDPAEEARQRAGRVLEFLFLAGLIFVTCGAGMVWLPLAFIVPGVILLSVAIVGAWKLCF